jgi:radical SAM superfamily enzyme YgiQ (UPF0313 family)
MTSGSFLMMNIVLVDMGSPRDELNEPLGIEVLGATLRHYFSPLVKVRLEYLQLSGGVLPQPSILLGSSLIGISASLYSLKRTKAILDLIYSAKYPDGEGPLVLLGNLLGTFAYREILDDYRDIVCVRGEGEDAIVKIVKTLMDLPSRNAREIKEVLCESDVPNLALMSRGDIKETTRKVVNLEKTVKPSRDFLPLIIKRRGIVRVEASRGCPWGHCSFCAISAKYGVAAWRPFQISRVLEELEELSRAGARSPYYTDEDFVGSDPKRALEIADRIISAKEEGRIDDKLNFYINLPTSGIVGDKTISAESCVALLKRLKEAGLREVFVGIESGARSQISRYRKRETAEKNIEAVSILRELNLEIDVGFIMFDPEMTFRDLKENLEFIRNTDLIDHDARDMKKVRVEPGTKLEEMLKVKKIIGPKFDVNSLSYSYVFLDPLVQKVFDAYQEWEKGALDVVYTIQGRCRGEASSEKERSRLKKFLGRFRRLDFEFLEACIRIAEESSGDLDEIEAGKKKLQNARSKLLQEVPKYLYSAQ